MISDERLEELARKTTSLTASESYDMAKELLAYRNAREGWQLVPVEPTDEMLSAALKFPAQTRKQYAAMLAAAPRPSTN